VFIAPLSYRSSSDVAIGMRRVIASAIARMTTGGCLNSGSFRWNGINNVPLQFW
jgi:hypothetical protein